MFEEYARLMGTPMSNNRVYNYNSLRSVVNYDFQLVLCKFLFLIGREYGTIAAGTIHRLTFYQAWLVHCKILSLLSP